MKKWDIFIGIDRDSENLARAKAIIEEFTKGNNSIPDMHFIHGSFAQIDAYLTEFHISSITGIMYDVGVSSIHFDEWERGFSFRLDWPLDMRFDRVGMEETASHLIHSRSERELFRILKDYGEESKAFFIAKAIVDARKKSPITTTGELVQIIEQSSFDKKSPVRVFQALRIELNQEFAHIEESLQKAVRLLALNGRIAVISFHSLEDRVVKQTFAQFEKDEIDDFTGQTKKPAVLKRVNKKPILPTEEEIQNNPRSRSAKLRIVQKQSDY